jgi:hypothetical protein
MDLVFWNTNYGKSSKQKIMKVRISSILFDTPKVWIHTAHRFVFQYYQNEYQKVWIWGLTPPPSLDKFYTFILFFWDELPKAKTTDFVFEIRKQTIKKRFQVQMRNLTLFIYWGLLCLARVLPSRLFVKLLPQELPGSWLYFRMVTRRRTRTTLI